MNSQSVQIRIATENDAPALVALYAPYVLNTAVTFEYEVPSIQEFAARIRHTLVKYPYLVASYHGEIAGYAYAGPFHARPAYDWAVETSIYIRQDCRRLGVGSTLYDALEKLLFLQGVANLNACIAYPAQEDPYLTKDSVAFHRRLGYRLVGEFHQCGYKFHRWYNMVWMEKHIAPHTACQPSVESFSQLRDSLVRHLRTDSFPFISFTPLDQ